MTSNDPPADRPDEPDDDRHEAGSDNNWLSTLLRALEAFDSEGRRDEPERRRYRGGRSGLEFDVSIGSLDALGDRGGRPGHGLKGNSELDGEGDRQPRTRRYRRSESSLNHVTTRRHGSTFEVVADVSDAEPDDVSVGLDEETLVIAIEGSGRERIELPWAETEASASVKNGVLTVEVTHDHSQHAKNEGDD